MKLEVMKGNEKDTLFPSFAGLPSRNRVMFNNAFPLEINQSLLPSSEIFYQHKDAVSDIQSNIKV